MKTKEDLMKRAYTAQLQNEKGFTLIEMAIVLVIIGLILGAVIKGKDVMNSAKQKKFYTSFVKEWELSAASYYDRTGNLLGDSTVNGGTQAARDGRFDNVSGATFGAANGIDAKLKAVGLTVPTTNTANSGQITFTGTYSGNQMITLYLYYLYSNTDGRSRNALYLRNMPTDLAIALDTLIDGEADPVAGKFRQYPDNVGTTWPDASTTTVVNAALTVDLP